MELPSVTVAAGAVVRFLLALFARATVRGFLSDELFPFRVFVMMSPVMTTFVVSLSLGDLLHVRFLFVEQSLFEFSVILRLFVFFVLFFSLEFICSVSPFSMLVMSVRSAVVLLVLLLLALVLDAVATLASLLAVALDNRLRGTGDSFGADRDSEKAIWNANLVRQEFALFVRTMVIIVVVMRVLWNVVWRRRRRIESASWAGLELWHLLMLNARCHNRLLWGAVLTASLAGHCDVCVF